MFAWLVLLGASYAVKKHAHLGVDVIINVLPQPARRVMALITVAAVLSVFDGLWDGAYDLLVIALWIIAIGAAITTARRAWRIIAQMNA